MQKFINDFRSLHSSILAVPIYTEPLTPVNDLQGATIINLNQNIIDYTHINNLSNLILLHSRSDRFKGEIKAVSSLAPSSVDVHVPVVEDFKVGDTVIYPVFAGLIDSKNLNIETDVIARGAIEFKEIRADVG